MSVNQPARRIFTPPVITSVTNPLHFHYHLAPATTYLTYHYTNYLPRYTNPAAFRSRRAAALVIREKEAGNLTYVAHVKDDLCKFAP